MNPEVSGLVGSPQAATPKPAAMCACSRMHPGVPYRERPPAHVVMYANPCRAKSCDGRLLCVGHEVCAECIAAIRSGKAGWVADKTDIDLYAITSAGLS